MEDIVGAALIAGAGLVLVVVGVLQRLGRLPRNHVAGLRTTETLRSDEAWRAGHDATSGIVTASGLPPIVAGAVIVTRAPDEPWLALTVIGSLGVTVAMVLIAGARAHRVAKAVNDTAGSESGESRPTDGHRASGIPRSDGERR